MNKRIVLIFTTIALFFTLFVCIQEAKFSRDAEAGLRSQAEVMALNLWLFNSDVTKQSLDFLAKLNNYKSAEITDFTGLPFATANPIELTEFSKILLKVGLIKTKTLSLAITYNSKDIGTMAVEKYNLQIYDYLYLLSILILFMILVIALDRIDHINTNLETIVANKTDTLKRSEESLLVTLNSIGEGLLAVDETGTVVRLNAVAKNIIGCQNGECIGKSIQDIIYTDDIELNSLFSFDQIEKINRIGVISVQKVDKTISATVSPIIDNEGKRIGVVYVLSDITEKLRNEENLKHSQKMESVGRLAGGVAHDFNNMLGGILGAAELLKDETPEHAHDLISLITESADRAAGLTGKLLAFSRKGKTESSPVNVHQAIASAISILSHSVSKKIKIIANLTAEESVVIGDIGQLQNCFLNMGINSSHAIFDSGEIEFSTRTVIYTGLELEKYCLPISAGKYVEITVRDSGSGISEENKQKIFEPFFTTKEQGKGTGLGLSAVHGTVLDHNGAITVESELGEGTSFHIFLPVSNICELVSDDIKQAAFLKFGGTALVIDDEPVMRETARLHLQKAGFVVVTAVDGQDGVEKYIKHHEAIDLVIVDMIMPRMDGRETLKAIKEHSPNLPVILTSGFTRTGEFEDFRKIGFHDVLCKPYKMSELVRICSSALESHAK